MNAPLTATASGMFCALKMIADPKNQIARNLGRHHFRRCGLAGGHPGAPASLELIAPRSTARKPISKGGILAPAGSLVVIQAPESAGHGPPLGRDKNALSEDLLDGYVAPAEARRAYGVEPA